MKSNALWLRAQIIRAIRDFFWERGFLEVETPLLIPANAPEEHINPFITLPCWQLQTSPEICMKRLLCTGHQRIFQISHCWRSDERGSRHLSEFTMLEWYRAGCDYLDLMADCEGLLQHVASVCLPGNPVYRRKSREIDPFQSWRRISVQEAFLRFGQVDVWDCLQKGLYEEILTAQVEPGLAEFSEPVILMDYPSKLAALARLKPDQNILAERFELYMGGLELANGFSELNNPVEQRRRFEEANRLRLEKCIAPLPMPEPFLRELSDMPPSAGIALGVDRLVMLAAGADTIDQVVAFTPEEL
ncbi:MAG: EF-P lysine aminoacylase GenX [Deltaproteobacteria bacterium]|nr:EF-P lysine aminoacylase GenX [Deltaproteobacteria bacterium]